ncbi:acetyl/propionyl/methylcrotonyl-CoA carboxylase subunit alpha [Streptomyces zagrosensis]|uniref:acetyl/propionyl/methylcrotonyl-CoA carboxylase subunit alpha n=1 Tax=Streptomyces zagrosensis TaxID=1042984 RepID=UPI001614CCEC|nr:biotin carboxylase N-terminal domain-containing protein [Streptomyces zagrosensis]
MISTLLVANRGEIARRIFRTCRELGIATVAVYSDADADAPHTREADAAFHLPGNAPADTYLRGDLLVAAALTCGADAVHPGYGFLSENPDFARAVTDAGLIWVGPPPAAIASMASKTRAKEIMADAGVPLLAPVRAEDATAADLPLLVKAAAGGGGRGMRLVRELSNLPSALAAASTEAASAFGDGEVFAEPYVENGRHVEVQILADAHGTVWVLGTRDCSLQRRHQKVIEEAPAPALPAALRAALHTAATEAAEAIGYQGAGTVEFLVAPGGRGYFLEMNTRLQVEHPVTECVYGIDLVALQLRVAEGHALPAAPPEPTGHAVEARLYAEDPARDWQPQTGVLHRLEVAGAGVPELSGPLVPAGLSGLSGLRVDSGFGAGDTIGIHYDPMLAKVIAWAPTRAEAIRRLAHALERSRVHGPVTNRELLVRSLRHPEFIAAQLDTGFYERHLDALTAAPDDNETRVAALAAALADACGRSRFGGWRNVPSQPQTKTYRLEPDGTEHEIRYRHTRDGLTADGLPDVHCLSATRSLVVLEVGGVRRQFAVFAYEDGSVYVDVPRLPGGATQGPGSGSDPGAGPSRGAGGRAPSCASYTSYTAYTSYVSYALTPLPRFPDPTARTEPGSLLAPMPGTVIRLANAAVGDAVQAGQPLLWLEAMKMEHKIIAPASGTLAALPVAPGQQVEVGALLAVVSD